jgi:hypothetical protein
MKQYTNEHDHSPPSPYPFPPAQFRAMTMETTQPLSVNVPTPKAIKNGNVHLDSKQEIASFNVGWEEPVLTRMSVYYPLTRSHRRFPKSELNTVLKRLVAVFQLLSLKTSFRDSPLEASCQSIEQVELVVNLWDFGEDPTQAVLEITRVAGDTVPYCGYMKQIFAAVFRKESVTTNCEQYNGGIISQRMDAILQRLPIPAVDPVPGSLEITLHLMLSDRHDSRCLGLESLVILTSTAKTDLSVATAVAKAMLLGRLEGVDGTVLTDMRIRDRIFYLALLGRWPDTPEESEYALTDDKSHAHLALMAMANAIGLLKEESDFATILEAASCVTGCSLIPSMQERVWDAHDQPHAAYLATRILSALCRGQPCAVRSCVELDAVRNAQHVGRCSHAALETEIGRLLLALEAA